MKVALWRLYERGNAFDAIAFLAESWQVNNLRPMMTFQLILLVVCVNLFQEYTKVTALVYHC